MPLLIAMLGGLAMMCTVLGVFRTNRPSIVRTRVTRIVESGPGTLSTDDDALIARIFRPAAGRFASGLASLLPSRWIAAIDARIETSQLTVTTARFVTLWFSVGIALPVCLALLLVVVGGLTQGALLLCGLVAVLGLYVPWLWLRRKANARTRAIERALPDAVDLIVTDTEAGLGLQAAMLSVSSRFRGPIASEFARVIRETSLGRPRDEALEAMGRRANSHDVQMLARAVAQSERSGVPIAEVLRGYARDIRRERRERAREQAGKIPLKVTLPTVFFIFPTMFLWMLGPIVLNMLDFFNNR